MKRKILFCNEFSLLGTGFATYGHEIIQRLHATGKFDIAEFSLYVNYSDPRIGAVPWSVYSNLPQPENQAEIDAYNNNLASQFGAWRFEEVLLDFKPDIVVCWMDPWMLEYTVTSPLRPYYNLVLMPTCDSSPQTEYWLDLFRRADGVFTYSEWANKVLAKEGGGTINLLGRCSPGADPNSYFPVKDKAAHKVSLGLDANMNIVGTVMRNQKRKLYPELFESFKLFLQKTSEDIANKTYLYCHTSFPDLGWDIPALIKNYGLSHKVILTYFCQACGLVFPTFFKGTRSVCPKCGQFAASMTNTQHPVSTQVLGAIYNTFDVYVQHVIAEGFALPIPEAAACGVHAMVTNATALEDFPETLKATPINVNQRYLEAETQAYRVYPSNEHLATELKNFFDLPSSWRKKKSDAARAGFLKNYSYDVAAKKWEEYFDGAVLKSWTGQPRLHNPQTALPANATNEQFVNWCLIHVLGEPELIGSYLAMKLVKDLDIGANIPGFGGSYINEFSAIGNMPRYQPFRREDAAKQLYELCQKRNYWEQRRIGQIQQPAPDFIRFAKKCQ